MPYPFGNLFCHHYRDKRTILFHRILAVVLYGQIVFFWSDLSKTIRAALSSELSFFLIPCAMVFTVIFFFYFLGIMPWKNKKVSIVAAFAISYCNMMTSFCFNFMVTLATSDSRWTEPVVVGGFIIFLISFIACVHIISLHRLE
jgi:hypothetical protein